MFTITKLHTNDIYNKTHWLEMARLACAGYEEPDRNIVCQAISQGNQM